MFSFDYFTSRLRAEPESFDSGTLKKCHYIHVHMYYILRKKTNY